MPHLRYRSGNHHGGPTGIFARCASDLAALNPSRSRAVLILSIPRPTAAADEVRKGTSASTGKFNAWRDVGAPDRQAIWGAFATYVCSPQAAVR